MPRPANRVLLLITLLSITLVIGNSLTEDEAPNQNQNPDLPVNHLPFLYSKFSPGLAAETPTLRSGDGEPGLELDTDKKPTNTEAKVVNRPHPHANGNSNHYCWGYEPGCDFTKPSAFSYPYPIPFLQQPLERLPYFGDIPPTIDDGRALFFSQADFGYVRAIRDSVRPVCVSDQSMSQPSTLECSDLLGFCRARNIVIDFRQLEGRTAPIIYDTDVLRDGDIGGNCDPDTAFLDERASAYVGSLTTWGPELNHFKRVPGLELGLDQDNEICDVVLEKPTFIMKLDATNNMYHHFCDFFNLYSTLHVNSSGFHAGDSGHNIFGTDNYILIWRSWYQSPFEGAFKSFTRNPVLTLAPYFGKRVCFKDVVFSMLPRMVAGLYYSSPVVPGYRGSGLFRAFSEFMLHRLKIPEPEPESEPASDARKIRVTFLSRQTTFRRILNEEEIIHAIEKSNPNLVVTKVVFTEKTDFMAQLRIIRATDVLIGMHGAGLTHLLFLPRWAVVFEIYHCEDPNCYSELARFAGIQYLTWEDSTKLTAVQISAELEMPQHYHKFANYVFDVDETVRLTHKAANLVIQGRGQKLNRVTNEAFIYGRDHDEL